jgi:hypothetical protein
MIVKPKGIYMKKPRIINNYKTAEIYKSGLFAGFIEKQELIDLIEAHDIYKPLEVKYEGEGEIGYCYSLLINYKKVGSITLANLISPTRIIVTLHSFEKERERWVLTVDCAFINCFETLGEPLLIEIHRNLGW